MTSFALDAPVTSTADRIRLAATNLFNERGYHGTTMREIAAEVGIKVSSLYNHYSSKHDLLFQITSSTLVELVAGAKNIVSSIATPEDKLRKLIEWHVTFHAQNIHRAKVADDQIHALDPGSRSTVLKMRRDYEDILKEILVEGRDTAGWTVPDVTIVSFAMLTAASSVGKWFREDGRLSARAVATIYSDFYIGGIKGS